MNKWLRDPRTQPSQFPKVHDGRTPYSIGCQYNDTIEIETKKDDTVGVLCVPGYKVQGAYGRLVDKGSHEEIDKLPIDLFPKEDKHNEFKVVFDEWSPHMKCWRVISQEVKTRTIEAFMA